MLTLAREYRCFLVDAGVEMLVFDGEYWRFLLVNAGVCWRFVCSVAVYWSLMRNFV